MQNGSERMRRKEEVERLEGWNSHWKLQTGEFPIKAAWIDGGSGAA